MTASRIAVKSATLVAARSHMTSARLRTVLHGASSSRNHDLEATTIVETTPGPWRPRMPAGRPPHFHLVGGPYSCANGRSGFQVTVRRFRPVFVSLRWHDLATFPR